MVLGAPSDGRVNMPVHVEIYWAAGAGFELAIKALRAYPQLSQISEVVFVCTRHQVFLPTFYTQPVLPRR